MSEPSELYELTFDERPDYLYACVKADKMTREIALSYLSKIADECTRLRCKRLVIERDVPVMLADSDLFFTTSDFTKMIKGVRVAFVNPHSNIDDHMEFAMIIGTNRGARFSLHSTVKEAEVRLLDRAFASKISD